MYTQFCDTLMLPNHFISCIRMRYLFSVYRCLRISEGVWTFFGVKETHNLTIYIRSYRRFYLNMHVIVDFTIGEIFHLYNNNFTLFKNQKFF